MNGQTATSAISEKLSEHNIRPSVQRMAVYKFLVENEIHPTADTIYSALAPQIPTLSRTTVYNTLKQFVDCGLVQTITIEDGILRYDARTENHIHFKCTCCGKVFDILNSAAFSAQSLPDGFCVEKVQTNLWGRCRACQSKPAASL